MLSVDSNPFHSILPALGSGRKSRSAPSFKKGTKYVSRTGLAKLHKGEAVLNKKQAKRYRGAAEALGSGSKNSNKTRRLIRAAGHELKQNPPKVLKTTARKKGTAAAGKQRVAIMLSKARSAGANIPEK